MFTISYKGLFINGYCDRREVWIVDEEGRSFGIFPSLRSAKLFITRRAKEA